MNHGHQPSSQGEARPTPPTSGSGVKPPPGQLTPERGSQIAALVAGTIRDRMKLDQDSGLSDAILADDMLIKEFDDLADRTVGAVLRVLAEQFVPIAGYAPARHNIIEPIHLERIVYAAKGGNASSDTSELLDFVADRLVSVHGENQGTDYIRALRERAVMLRIAVRDGFDTLTKARRS